MRFGSICSGIEAASVAWNPLGWEAAWFSEIEPFPCEVLKHHYPDVRNHGDMSDIARMIWQEEIEAPDILCGGTPCQAFSVAGQRRSLDDDRGNLSLVFCEIANALDATRFIQGSEPSIVFWENVPGVLNTKDNAFGCFLAELVGSNAPLKTDAGRWPSAGFVAGLTRKAAWRVLDAQYFGVPQRRKRVFVVASARKDFDPAKVLFELPSLPRDSESSQNARKEAAGEIEDRSGESSAVIYENHAQDARYNEKTTCPTIVSRFGTGGNNVPLTVFRTPPHVFKIRSGCEGGGKGYLGQDDKTFTLATGRDQYVMAKEPDAAVAQNRVRKLTVIECERLQGFPDNYTRIPYKGKSAADCPDSPRYKALGNSWAVPCVRWIGERIKRQISEAQNAY